MRSFDVGSKEAIAWTAGFFCGEGCISVAPCASSYNGQVQVTQKKREPLDIIREILIAHNIVTPELYHRRKQDLFELTLHSTNGAEFLQLLSPYPMNGKHRKRAEIYLRMFPPGGRYRHRPKERRDTYVEWLQLRVVEQKGEKDEH